MIPSIVMWWVEALCPGSATANPANSITTSEGTGMHALDAAISRKIAGSPPSRTRWAHSLTIDSEIEARTSTSRATIPAAARRSAERDENPFLNLPADARLGGPDQQPSRAGDAPGDRAPARAGTRGPRDRTGLRPDAGAVRAARRRAHGDRQAPRRAGRRQGGR